MRVRWRLAVHWFSNLLIALGLIIVVGTGGLYAYSRYEAVEYARAAAQIVPVSPVTSPPTSTASPVALAPVASPTLDAVTLQRNRQIAERRDSPPATATPTPLPTATPIPIAPADRIVAPAISMDAKVVESKIVNGEWQVPKFAVGHLEGTAQPLEGGNVVLAGHIDSISSGDVFAHIGKLKPGDMIQVYTPATIVKYRVTKLMVVSNTDLAVVRAQPEETLTLITCTGTWLPLQRDFDRRLVVIADRVT